MVELMLDALIELGDMLVAHPVLVAQHISEICKHTSQRIIDSHPVVRKAFVSFIRKFLILVDEAKLGPFASLFVVYINTALSHAVQNMNMDGIMILDTFLSFYPGLFARYYDQVWF